MKTKTRLTVLTLLIILIVMFATPVKVYAHGAHIEYSTGPITIEITSKYDNGEPMKDAQVTIYSPDDYSTAWVTGTCDDEGRFTFTPDTSILGDWKVKVRLAGHGDIIYIPVSEAGVESSSSDSDYSTLQIILMSASVVWGTIGTALFFLRRRKA